MMLMNSSSNKSNSKAVRYLMLEDEYYSRLDMEHNIASIRPNYRLVGEASDTLAAVELIAAHHPDLIFADVELCDGKSYDVLCNYPIPVVYFSEYRHVRDMLPADTLCDFILKPVSGEALRKSIIKYEHRLSKLRLRDKKTI